MADPNAPSWATASPDPTVPTWASGPPQAAPQRAPGATGFFDQIGQTAKDLISPDRPQHSPNALEQGLMDVGGSKPIQSLNANYLSAVSNGIFMQPVRAAMESLGVGRQPGESDASLHQRYNNAIALTRQQAQQRAQANTIGSYDGNPIHAGERLLQQTGNVAANIAANPEYFLLPGMGVGNSVAARVATAGAGNAAVGSVSDAAAQLMDMASGAKKNFDIKQNLEQTATAGLFGAGLHGTIEVAPHIQNLFATRGMDTTPPADPRTSTAISPMTGDHVSMNAADHAQYQHLLQTGSVDDIKNFFQGRQGPQPSWQDVNTWVEHRDGPHPITVNGAPGGPNPEMQPDFNYNDEYNRQAENDYKVQNRQAVQDHVNASTANWKNAPDVEVVHGPEDIADPEIRAQAQREDTNGDALGFLGTDGKVRMFSGRITDPDTANAVLFHEGLGHFGLAQKFGGKLDSTLQTLLDRNVGHFGSRVDAWQKANPGAYGGDRVRAAEEVLAEDSQNGAIKPSWRDAVTASVKQFGRKMGLKLAYSDAEVNHILAMAHDAVIKGTDVRSNGFQGATQSDNKFMFTGPRATGFDREHPTAVRGPDGTIHNEISDRDAELTMPMGTLGQSLDHPELYKQYPQLRDLKVRYRSLFDDGMDAYYHIGTPETAPHMVVEAGLGDAAMRRVMLHETQHAIQHIEGRLRPDTVTAGLNDEEYRNDPLETEARSTESRRDFTDEQRTMRVPTWATAVPLHDFLGKSYIEDGAPVSFDLGETELPASKGSGTGYIAKPNTLSREHLDEMLPKAQEFGGRYAPGRAETAFQFKTEEAREQFVKAVTEGTDNKYITKSQLAAQPGYRADDLEGVYNALAEGYKPTTLTWDDQQTAALKAGFSPGQIRSLKETNPGDLSVRLYRMQSAANMADAKISELNQKLDTPDWSEKDQAEYLKVLADRNYLVTRIKGERAEIGRALQTAKAAGSYNNSTMQAVADLLEQHGSGLAGLAVDPTAFLRFARQIKGMMDDGNPEGAQNMMGAVNKPYWEQYLNTFHMNMMLSGLSTHVKAPVDMATGITRNVIEKALAIPVGKARELFISMTGRTPQPGVEPAELANHMIGVLRAVTDAEVYRRVAHAAMTGESSYVDASGNATPTNFANLFGAQSGPRIPIVSKPTDLISAQDTFFRSVEINAQLGALGARAARAELGPNASTTDVMAMGHAIATNPSPAMIKEAYDLTNRTLLLNDNPLNKVINRARTYRPGMTPWERVGAFVVSNLAPFIRVESNNLINRVIQRSPLAFLDPYTQKQIQMGGANADIAMTKIMYGTALIGMYWAGGSAILNKVTGSGPDNVNKFKEAQAAGFSPRAVHENGRYNVSNSLAMSVNPFDSHNATATMVADARQQWDEGMNKGSVLTAVKLALGATIHNLAEMSWVSDIAPAVKALTAHGTEGQSDVASFASNEAKSWMPNAMNQTARLQDPFKRDISGPDNVLNDLQSTVPGLREHLPIKYSVYGTPLQNGASLTGVHTIIPGLSGNGTTETNDPAERELDRLNSLVPGALVTPVSKTITLDDGTKKALAPAEFEEYQRVAGRAIVETTRTEMGTDQWHKMSDQDRVLEVRSIQTDMKRAAREALFNR